MSNGDNAPRSARTKGTPMDIDFERLRLQRERDLRFAERAHDQRNNEREKLNDAAVTGGDKALQALMYINGGAAIAMLGFVGAFAGREKIDLGSIARLAPGLAYFAFGVAFAVGAMGTAYFVNLARAEAFGHDTHTFEHPYCTEQEVALRLRTWAYRIQFLAFVLGVCSLWSFLFGAFSVRDFIEKMPKPPAFYRAQVPSEV